MDRTTAKLIQTKVDLAVKAIAKEFNLVPLKARARFDATSLVLSFELTDPMKQVDLRSEMNNDMVAMGCAPIGGILGLRDRTDSRLYRNVQIVGVGRARYQFRFVKPDPSEQEKVYVARFGAFVVVNPDAAPKRRAS